MCALLLCRSLLHLTWSVGPALNAKRPLARVPGVHLLGLARETRRCHSTHCERNADLVVMAAGDSDAGAMDCDGIPDAGANSITCLPNACARFRFFDDPG